MERRVEEATAAAEAAAVHVLEADERVLACARTHLESTSDEDEDNSPGRDELLRILVDSERIIESKRALLDEARSAAGMVEGVAKAMRIFERDTTSADAHLKLASSAEAALGVHWQAFNNDVKIEEVNDAVTL